MIEVETHRQYVNTALASFFQGWINHYKNTRLQNVSHCPADSDEYLAAVMINCLLSEVEDVLQKKIVNTTGTFIKIKFSDAQAVVLYKQLLAMPIQENKDYLLMVRQDWINRLYKKILATGLLKATTTKPNAATAWTDYFAE